MDLSFTRRELLRTGVALAASSAMPIWLRADSQSPAHPLLVVVFLRGAADGLHLVPPIGDPHYASGRQSLALHETLRLPESFSGHRDFALHPALGEAMSLAERGELAIVHAAGSPDGTRSHFSAQDQMEAGRPGALRVGDGWLARALTQRGGSDPFSSLALGGGLPLALRGSGAFSITAPEAFSIPGASASARRQLAAAYQDTLPDIGADTGTSTERDPVAAAGRAALDALDDFEARMGTRKSGQSERQLRRGWRRGARGAPRSGLTRNAELLAQLIDVGLPVRAVCLESSGWDTHRGQGLASGAFANRAADLAGALVKLAEIGRRRGSWLVVVMTEFGRTVKPNGSGGSDHGHGSVMLVAGSGIRAGVHGDWPGLAPARLYEGRDLVVANDYRNVLGEVLRGHLGDLPPAATFPDFTPGPLGLIA